MDLDGTLIKSDLTVESLLALIRQNFLYLLMIPLWLLKGRAFLKHKLAARVRLRLEAIPFNEEFLSFLKQERNRGRSMTLISASNAAYVEQLNADLGLFDQAFGSDRNLNLKADNKLRRIRELNNGDGFAYAGNSRADLPIWSAADEVLMVNCSPGLVSKLHPGARAIRQFDQVRSWPRELWRAMRPHQWLKNCLIFVPLLLSHQLDRPELILQALIAFISFCLCASSVYLLNDLFDLSSDRQHLTKSSRPLAAGSLGLRYGVMAIPALLIAAFAVSLALPREFTAVLLFYWILTTLYSLLLKRMLVIDVITLATLYTLRIIAGSAAISVVTTNYLIAFSMLLFLSLALVKRVAELKNLQLLGKTTVAGRAYNNRHMRWLAVCGALSSLLAVAVFAVYINDPATTRLYSSPLVLWTICPLLLFVLARIWWTTQAGKMDEDPVLFAAADRMSQLTTLACATLVWLAI